MKSFWAACLVFVAASAGAQNNEIALTVGGYFPQHVYAKSENVFVVQGNIARRIFHFPKASLYIELPIASSAESKVVALAIPPGTSFFTSSYSALFVSPGLKLKFVPDSRLSPYLAVGGGLAHFSRNQTSGSTNTGVFDVGAGLDWNLARFISLRGEVRDFYSGAPQLIQGLLDREHQILATGGIVFRF